MKNPFYSRDLVSIADFNLTEIEFLLNYAAQIKQDKIVKPASGKLLASCFFEPSTRTRLSFESSMLKLGGQIIGFADPTNTSEQKGESLYDSMKVISPYADIIVLRHPREGAARLAAQASDKPVINAGDGANKHPTQTLLDLFTIKECQGNIDNLNIALVGDLKYSRTIHSLVRACALYKTRFFFICPNTLMMPEHICHFLKTQGVRFSFHQSIEEVIKHLDIIYMTRLQKERFQTHEYAMIQQQFTLQPNMLVDAKKNLKILHPLPRIKEIDPTIDDTPYAYYFQQAANALPVRQAILSAILNEDLTHG